MFVDQGVTIEPAVDEVGQLLLDAADVLERYGWRQREYGNPDTGFCMMGAIMFVQQPQNGIISVGHTPSFRATLRLQAHLGRTDIVGWNDDLGRSKGQVLNALRAAARAEAA